MLVPDGLRYSQDHQWVRRDGELLTVGLTAFAQDALGEVTMVQFLDVASPIEAGSEMGEVEAFKAMTDLYMPVDATLVRANPRLATDPTIVNRDPYGDGWLCLVRPANPASVDELLDAAAYRELIGIDAHV